MNDLSFLRMFLFEWSFRHEAQPARSEALPASCLPAWLPGWFSGLDGSVSGKSGSLWGGDGRTSFYRTSYPQEKQTKSHLKTKVEQGKETRDHLMPLGYFISDELKDNHKKNVD